MSTHVAPKGDTVFCRECGKPIEADARFCRFCGKAQADRPGSAAMAGRSGPASRSTSRAADGLEAWLRQLFPRHHLQDAFTHLGTITAFFLAVIGFVLGFITPALFGENFLSIDFLLASIALLLFLILRESTLSHIRTRGGPDAGSAAGSNRYQAARRSSTDDLPAEAATTQSSPPTGRPASPAPPSSGRPPSRQ